MATGLRVRGRSGQRVTKIAGQSGARNAVCLGEGSLNMRAYAQRLHVPSGTTILSIPYLL